MARYRVGRTSPEDVYDTQRERNLLRGKPEWTEYAEWLAEGNVIDPVTVWPRPTNNDLIEQEYAHYLLGQKMVKYLAKRWGTTPEELYEAIKEA